MLFTDETSTKTNMVPIRGRAPKKPAASFQGAALPLPAADDGGVFEADGIVAPYTFKGAMNTNRFRCCLERRLIPTLCKITIMFVDNLPVHKSKRGRDLCRRAGMIHLFLPRYSPQCSPNKKFFSKLKSVLRRLQPRTIEEVIRTEHSVDRSVGAAECINDFKAVSCEV